MKRNGKFAHLIQKHLDIDEKKEEEETEQKQAPKETKKPEKTSSSSNGMLIVKEDRSQGNVGISMYMKYVRYGGGVVAGLLLAFSFVILQVHRVINDVRNLNAKKNTKRRLI